jgi:hypothetical protein
VQVGFTQVYIEHPQNESAKVIATNDKSDARPAVLSGQR